MRGYSLLESLDFLRDNFLRMTYELLGQLSQSRKLNKRNGGPEEGVLTEGRSLGTESYYDLPGIM